MHLAVLLASIVIAAPDSQITDPNLGFTITIPDGFVSDSVCLATGAYAHCWSEAAPPSPDGSLVIAIERMGGVLPTELLKPEDAPAGITLVRRRWRSFEIDGTEQTSDDNGVPFLTLGAQIPLRNEGIQLVVGAPVSEAARARALMTSTLASLSGESNWLTSTQRAERLGKFVGRVLIGIFIVVMLIWLRQREKAKKAARP